MVQNAKDFNDKKSLIFEDAERVRKGASNWFVKHNPAYNDKNYVARPTPVPGEGVVNGNANANGNGGGGGVSLKITNKAAPGPVRAPGKSATPAPAGDEEDEDAPGEEAAVAYSLGDYKGKTFQQAQVQLIEELIDYQEYVKYFLQIVFGTNVYAVRMPTFRFSRRSTSFLHDHSQTTTKSSHIPSHSRHCRNKSSAESGEMQQQASQSSRAGITSKTSYPTSGAIVASTMRMAATCTILLASLRKFARRD